MANDTVIDVAGGCNNEIWAPMPAHGYEDIYEISSCGRARRRVADCRGRVLAGRVLKPSYTAGGKYVQYALCKNRKYKIVLVARMVLAAFVSSPPTKGHHAAHLNGNAHDNRIENLAWKTPKENDMDKDLHGTRQSGMFHPMRKLCEKDVLNIRHMKSLGMTITRIADIYGISQSNAYAICSGKTWKTVTTSRYERCKTRNDISDDIKERARLMLNDGASARSVAAHLSISRYRVSLITGTP